LGSDLILIGDRSFEKQRGRPAQLKLRRAAALFFVQQ
jgi:hypothetical protein